MAIANANYEFIYCDTGTNGRVSDGGVLSNTEFFKRLSQGTLRIPELGKVPNSNMQLPYVFVGDEAFALRSDFLKPYPRADLDWEEKIFNYRLSRARRIIENAFGILTARFRIFRAPINLGINKINKLVMACCALHNYLLRNESESTPDLFGSEIDENRQNSQNLHENSLENAKTIRDNFKRYFNNEGRVSWQENAIS